jgi:hypothetical protein
VWTESLCDVWKLENLRSLKEVELQ